MALGDVAYILASKANKRISKIEDDGSVVAPTIGSNGNWFIGERDTGISATGKSPYIGKNNNWFVWDGTQNKYIDSGIKSSGDITEAQKEEVKNSVLQDPNIVGLGDAIQDLEDNKANYKYKVIATDKVSQLDATEVLEFYDQYDGKLIEFLTNGDLPSKCVATGRLMTDKQGNSYLITYNLDGTTTIWNRDGYEKHQIETRNLINEPIVEMDSLTIDKVGDAPFLASVRAAKNKPPETSDDGVVLVIAHSIKSQIQIYKDMVSGKTYQRIITGEADRHTFNGWTATGGGASNAGELSAEVPEGLTAEANVQSVLNAIRKQSVPYYDDYIDNVNNWNQKNGYIKTGDTTSGLPTEGNSKWGILFFIAERVENGTGTQMFFPIDGDKKGTVWVRSIVRKSPSEWKQIPISASDMSATVPSNLVADGNVQSILNALALRNPSGGEGGGTSPSTAEDISAVVPQGLVAESNVQSIIDAINEKSISYITYSQIFSREEWMKNDFDATVVRQDNGELRSEGSGYRSTDFIRVKPSQKYTVTTMSKEKWGPWDRKFYCYRKDKSYISFVNLDWNKQEFTTLPETFFIRFTGTERETSVLDDPIIIEGSRIPDKYFYGTHYGLAELDYSISGYENSIQGNKLMSNSISGDKILNKSVTSEKVFDLLPETINGIEFINKFDYVLYEEGVARPNGSPNSELVLNGYLSGDRLTDTGGDYRVIVFPCKKNTYYNIYNIDKNGLHKPSILGSQIGFINDSNVIKGLKINNNNYETFLTLDDTKAILFTLPGTNNELKLKNIKNLMITEGEGNFPKYIRHQTRPTWLLNLPPATSSLNVVCYGDSLTQDKYPKKLSEILQCNVVDAGVGGNTVSAIHNRVGNYGSDFNVVTLMCGTNDNGGQTSCPLGTVNDPPATDENATSSSTTYVSRLKRLLNKIKTTHRGATYILMPPFQHEWGIDIFDKISILMRDVSEIYSIPYLDIYHECGWLGNDPEDKKMFMADGTHENERGAERIAELLAGKIKLLKGI